MRTRIANRMRSPACSTTPAIDHQMTLQVPDLDALFRPGVRYRLPHPDGADAEAVVEVVVAVLVMEITAITMMGIMMEVPLLHTSVKDKLIASEEQ